MVNNKSPIAIYAHGTRGQAWQTKPPVHRLAQSEKLKAILFECISPETNGFILNGNLLAVGSMERDPDKGRNESKQVSIFELQEDDANVSELSNKDLQLIDMLLKKRQTTANASGLQLTIQHALSLQHCFPPSLRDSFSLAMLPQRPALSSNRPDVLFILETSPNHERCKNKVPTSQYTLWLSKLAPEERKANISGLKYSSMAELESYSSVRTGNASPGQQARFLSMSPLEEIRKLVDDVSTEAIVLALGDATCRERAAFLLSSLPPDKTLQCPITNTTQYLLDRHILSGHVDYSDSMERIIHVPLLLKSQLEKYPASILAALECLMDSWSKCEASSIGALHTISVKALKDDSPVKYLNALHSNLQGLPKEILKEYSYTCQHPLVKDIAEAAIRNSPWKLSLPDPLKILRRQAE